MTRARANLRHRLRRVAAFAGVFALLLQVLLPVHGLAAPAGARVPVCTAAGIVWQALGGAPEAPPPGTDRFAAGCPFCMMHGAAFAPSARVAVALPVARLAPSLPLPAPEVAHVSPHFRAHPSRGPPTAA